MQLAPPAICMQAQIESGTLCPTTMTYGAVAAMRRDAGWRATGSAVLTREYDPRDIPLKANAAA